jgi:hypothetical protein
MASIMDKSVSSRIISNSGGNKDNNSGFNLHNKEFLELPRKGFSWSFGTASPREIGFNFAVNSMCIFESHDNINFQTKEG